MKIGQRHAEHVLHPNNACSGIGVWVCRPGRKRRMARGPEGRLPEKRASLPVPSVLALRQNTPPMRPATPSAPPNTDDITHTHICAVARTIGIGHNSATSRKFNVPLYQHLRCIHQVMSPDQTIPDPSSSHQIHQSKAQTHLPPGEEGVPLEFASFNHDSVRHLGFSILIWRQPGQRFHHDMAKKVRSCDERRNRL